MYQILTRILSIFVRFVIRVMREGEIPRHIAFIPDGNRRFAKNNKLVTKEGHTLGKDKLIQISQWCKKLGIKELTIYGFSIKNFERSQHEVENLFSVFKTAIYKYCEKPEYILKMGIKFNFIGNLNLLPMDLQQACAKIVEATSHLTELRANIAVAYSSQEEIYSAIKELLNGVEMGLIRPEDITEDVVQKCLYTADSTEPDLLIRTSGEIRLSDFLLWQTCYTHLEFLPKHWPEVTVWQLFKTLINYQRYYKYLQVIRF
ncbi:hypothetical protein CHUAL_008743 [Chamberlinius hualienensis]